MNDTDWKQIGKALQRKREDLGLTQRQAAERVGVHWQTIGRIERGCGRETAAGPLAAFAALVGYPLAEALAAQAVQS